MSAVQAAIAGKRIPTLTKDGRIWIDPEAADAAWAARTDPDQSNRARGKRKAQGNGHGAGADAVAEFHRERARRAKLEADRLQLRMNQEAGWLVDKRPLIAGIGAALAALSRDLINAEQRIAIMTRTAPDVLTAMNLYQAEMRRLITDCAAKIRQDEEANGNATDG